MVKEKLLSNRSRTLYRSRTRATDGRGQEQGGGQEAGQKRGALFEPEASARCQSKLSSAGRHRRRQSVHVAGGTEETSGDQDCRVSFCYD